MTQQSLKNETLNVRIDPFAKTKAMEILAGSGLNLSDAIRMFIARINADGRVPVGLLMNEEEYDTWFRAKVLEALHSDEPDCSHEEVMEEAKAIIDGKRNA
jgi:DNA-damage-inducible protein J